jgi:site-specific recombinase XerD
VKPRTFERYKGTITDFTNFLGDRKTAPLTSITPEDMISYREELGASGKFRGSRQRPMRGPQLRPSSPI